MGKNDNNTNKNGEKSKKPLTDEQFKAEVNAWLEKANDWDTLPLSIKGTCIVKTPKGLMININPEDDHGNKMTKNGSFVSNTDVLNGYYHAFEQKDKMTRSVRLIEELNVENNKKGKKVLDID